MARATSAGVPARPRGIEASVAVRFDSGSAPEPSGELCHPLTERDVPLYHNSITVRQHILRLNPSSGVPLYQQLIEQIRHAVEMCLLAPGDQLPSVRTLAQELVISPNTVVKAYSELAAEGVIDLRQGTGAFIADQERQPEAAHTLRSAHADMRRLVARFRERGLSDGEIRRLLESELLSSEEPALKRGDRR